MAKKRSGGGGPVALVCAGRGRGLAAGLPLDRRREIYAALAAIGEVVYFIRLGADVVKIGWTRNLKQRRYIGLSSNFDDLLAVFPGSYRDEQDFHQRFAAYRLPGVERFRLTGDLLDYINDVRARMNVPPVDETRMP